MRSGRGRGEGSRRRSAGPARSTLRPGRRARRGEAFRPRRGGRGGCALRCPPHPGRAWARRWRDRRRAGRSPSPPPSSRPPGLRCPSLRRAPRGSRTGGRRTRGRTARVPSRPRPAHPSRWWRRARPAAAPPARREVLRSESTRSWNSCSKLAIRRAPVRSRSSFSASRRKRRGQQAHGRPSVCTMSHRRNSRGLSPDVPSHPRMGARIREQAQISRRAEGVGFGQRPQRGEGEVGRNPADAGLELLVELGGEDRATSHDRPEVAADEGHEVGGAHPAAAATVPLSQMSSRNPIAPAPERILPASSRATTTIMPPAGMSLRSRAAARCSCGCR